MNTILLILAVLPVIILAFYIYKKDKYEKEPFGMLVLAFLLGIGAVAMDVMLVLVINLVYPGSTLFYEAFFYAGIPEEFSKWALFMLVIWRNKNFNECFDGIVYAAFIGLGFACVENIMYVFRSETFTIALHTSFLRALLSVPGHFLFAVMMGYFLGMAKFRPYKRDQFFLFSLLVPIAAHGIFDYLLMLSDAFSETTLAWLGTLLSIVFIYFDIRMWKFCLKKISKMQELTRHDHEEEEFYKNLFK